MRPRLALPPSNMVKRLSLVLLYLCVAMGITGTLSTSLEEIVPHVNGYIRLGFVPAQMEMERARLGAGAINISIDSEAKVTDQLYIKSFIDNKEIGTLWDTSPVEARNNSVFHLRVTGLKLGRTRIRFVVTKNRPNKQSFEMLNASNTWRMPYQYDIVVKNADSQVPIYLSCVVLGLMALNLIAVGGQIDGEEMVTLVKRPLAIGVGLICRFGVMPAVALGIVELLQPEHNTSLGVLSLICSTAEGASLLLITLAESDITFGATLSSANNFATIGMLPLWTILFETRIWESPGKVAIPFKEAFILFSYIVVSLAIGFLLSRKVPSAYSACWTYLPTFTIVTIIFALVVEIYNNNYVFTLVSKEIFSACMMLTGCGFAFGAVVAFIAQQPYQRIVVTCIDTGVRTTFLTTLLLDNSLPQPEADIAKTAPVLCCLLSVLPSMIIIILCRIYKRFVSAKKMDEVATYAAPSDEEEGEEGEEEEDQLDSVSNKVIVEEKETCM